MEPSNINDDKGKRPIIPHLQSQKYNEYDGRPLRDAVV